MGWVKIDDAFFTHRKVEGLSKDAKLLFVAGLTWCARELTDGFVSATGLRTSAALVDVKATTAKQLVDAGLWHKRADGYDVHDYLEYQPTAEEERQRRREHADRMKAWREARKGQRPPPQRPPRDGERDMSHDESRDPERDGPREPPCDSVSDALPDPVVPYSRTSPSPRLSGLRLLDDESAKSGEGNPQANGKPEPPWAEDRHGGRWQTFADRVVAVLGERHRQAAEALVDRWRTILAHQLIDQAIGLCEQAEKPPRTIAYFEKALVTTAAQNDVDVPPIPAGSVAAR